MVKSPDEIYRWVWWNLLMRFTDKKGWISWWDLQMSMMNPCVCLSKTSWRVKSILYYLQWWCGLRWYIFLYNEVEGGQCPFSGLHLNLTCCISWFGNLVGDFAVCPSWKAMSRWVVLMFPLSSVVSILVLEYKKWSQCKCRLDFHPCFCSDLSLWTVLVRILHSEYLRVSECLISREFLLFSTKLSVLLSSLHVRVLLTHR